MKRRRFTVEFKQQVVREVEEIGSVPQVAKRYELSTQMIYRWKKDLQSSSWQHAKSNAKRIDAYVPSPKEFQSLEKENTQLKQLLGDKDLEIAILRDLVKKIDPAYRIK